MNTPTKISRICLILLLFPLVVPAQNWQNICSPGITLYADQEDTLSAFRQDSIFVVGGGDSLFFSCRAIREITFFSCTDTSHGAILGRKVYKRADGWFFFFNKNQDTVFLNTQAAINQSWIFFDLPDNAYIQAEVTSIESDTVINTIDQLKTITFQAKDANHDTISHILNQHSIKLSQHYGLTDMLDVYAIPNETEIHKLIGKTTPEIGTQPMTWQDVYDFNVGDEFHHVGYTINYSGSANWEKIRKVLNKTVYGNLDSVTYSFERCIHMVGGPPPFTENTHDTITIIYNFIELTSDSSFFRLPEEFEPLGELADKYSVRIAPFNSRQSKEIIYDFYWYGVIDSCWSERGLGGMTGHTYTEGVGVTEYFNFDYGSNFAYYEALCYYKKGTETFGGPVAVDCNTLVSYDPKPINIESQISIYPNPASTHITIETLLQSQLSILNLNGQELLKQTITEPKTVIDISSLPNGIYFVRVTGDKTVGVGKFIKQ